MFAREQVRQIPYGITIKNGRRKDAKIKPLDFKLVNGKHCFIAYKILTCLVPRQVSSFTLCFSAVSFCKLLLTPLVARAHHNCWIIRKAGTPTMMQRRRISRSLAFLLSLLCLLLSSRSACCAYSAPAVFGLGALFRGKTVIAPSLGEEGVLTDAGTFFADAFWTDKARAAHRAAGGKDAGSVALTQVQAASLERQQVQEFRRRYGRRGGASTALADRRAELLVCSNASGEVVGCAGVEVDQICKADGRGSGPVMNQIRGPLMSNLAVGRNFRRRGIAEDLVRATEEMARKDWGYDECYLYVEKGNVPAVKLYKKLGYRVMWEDDRAKTLMPLESGKLITAPTVIVCMRKRLSGLGRWLPF